MWCATPSKMALCDIGPSSTSIKQSYVLTYSTIESYFTLSYVSFPERNTLVDVTTYNRLLEEEVYLTSSKVLDTQFGALLTLKTHVARL